MENTVFISLGSNMGNRYDYLTKAIKLLMDNPEIRLVNYSSVYETDPVGYEKQAAFLNMVIEVQTESSPDKLLEICMKIEQQLGRKREIRWGPRTIDLDILLYNQENINSEKLIVPHPRMFERGFVMIPLLEICPNLSVYGKEQQVQYANQLPNKEGVRIWKRKNGEDVFEPIES